MACWATSRLNRDYEERQKDHLDYGKAIHCFVLEGEAVYAERYAVGLDPDDYAGKPVLFSTDEIKAAIGRFTVKAPVQPKGATKQELLDQLVSLGTMHGVEVDEEGTVPQLRERIRWFEEEQPVSPVSRVPLDDGGTKSATKEDWAIQLLQLDPSALIWDDLVAKHIAAHDGRAMISAKDDRRIRVAGRMISGHPDLGAAFSGGHCEVSVFWYCRATGAPMKARFDYLKMLALLDLKSFSNMQDMPVDRAIVRAIANYKYNLQHVIYDEAAQEAKRMIREFSLEAIRHCDGASIEDAQRRNDFCLKWAEQQEPPAFIFVFQQSGIAPVTRGKMMPRGTVFSVTQTRATMLKKKWVECANTYGADPWLDIAPLEEIDDETIPLHATDLGRTEA